MADIKKNYLGKKNSVLDDGTIMTLSEAIETIEMDLNYTYAEAWIEQGVVNEPYKHTVDVSIQNALDLTTDEVNAIYYNALNAIIESNNSISNPAKKLTFVDLSVIEGEDGGSIITVNYLFGIDRGHISPDGIITFNFPGYYWHWDQGGYPNIPNPGLGYFDLNSLTTSPPTPIANQYNGAAVRINQAAQNNFNYPRWNSSFNGYYIINTTAFGVNTSTNGAYYSNTQMTQWRTLYGGIYNQFGSANVPEVKETAFYQCIFTLPNSSPTDPPNGYWWHTDGSKECLPDYAMNFYTERLVDLASNVVPSIGLINTGQSVYSFQLFASVQNQNNPFIPNTILKELFHNINLTIGTYISTPKATTTQPLPAGPVTII